MPSPDPCGSWRVTIKPILLNQLLNSDKQRAKIEAEEQSGISAHDAVRENPQVEPKGEAAQIPR